MNTCKLYIDIMYMASMNFHLFFVVFYSTNLSDLKVFESKSQEQPETPNEQSHLKHDNFDFQISIKP